MHLITNASRLSSFILDLGTRATVLLLLACLVIALLRRSSAATRHALWLITMVGLLLLPVTMLVIPVWQLPILPADVYVRDSPPTGTGVPLVRTPLSQSEQSVDDLTVTSSPQTPIVDSQPTVTHAAASREMAVKETLSVDRNSMDWNAWSWAVPVIWFFGVAVWCGRLLGGIGQVTRLRRASTRISDDSIDDLRQALSLHRAVELREHPEPIIPLTWGILRPVVLLPKMARDWSAPLRRAVLRHELAHIRRGDVMTQLIGRVACAVYWFHPLVWYAQTQMHREQEQACDDLAVGARGKASDYAERLVELARLCTHPSGLTMAIAMAEGSGVERRVTSLLDSSRGHGPVRRGMATLLLLVGLVVVGIVSVVEPVAVPAALPGATSPSDSSAVVPSRSDILLTDEAALQRVLDLKPSFGEPKRGIQLAAAYSTGQMVFRPGDRLPVDLFLRNAGKEEVLLRVTPLYEMFPPQLKNSQGDSVELSRFMHRFRSAFYVVRLKPGAVCVLQQHGIGIGAEQHAPSLETLEVDDYRLRYHTNVAALAADGTDLWQTQLEAHPLRFSVKEDDKGERTVRTPGRNFAGLISPESLELLNPLFGEARRGIQMGVAVASRRRTFSMDEVIPLMLCFRNVGSEPVTFHAHLDFIADPPTVKNENGEPMPVSYIMHWMFIGPTKISIKPGEIWGIPTTGLGLNGQPRSALTSPPPGKYILTYEEWISDTKLVLSEEPDPSLGQRVMTPTWSAGLKTGELQFEVTPQADGTLQAQLPLGRSKL